MIHREFLGSDLLFFTVSFRASLIKLFYTYNQTTYFIHLQLHLCFWPSFRWCRTVTEKAPSEIKLRHTLIKQNSDSKDITFTLCKYHSFFQRRLMLGCPLPMWCSPATSVSDPLPSTTSGAINLESARPTTQHLFVVLCCPCVSASQGGRRYPTKISEEGNRPALRGPGVGRGVTGSGPMDIPSGSPSTPRRSRPTPAALGGGAATPGTLSSAWPVCGDTSSVSHPWPVRATPVLSPRSPDPRVRSSSRRDPFNNQGPDTERRDQSRHRVRPSPVCGPCPSAPRPFRPDRKCSQFCCTSRRGFPVRPSPLYLGWNKERVYRRRRR